MKKTTKFPVAPYFEPVDLIGTEVLHHDLVLAPLHRNAPAFPVALPGAVDHLV